MKNTHIPVKLILALVCMLTATSMQAQGKKMTRGGGGGFTFGTGVMNVSALEAFVPNNLWKFNHDQTLIGGMGHGFIKRFVIGGGGFGIIGDKIKTDSMQYSMGGGMGTFDFGYVILDRAHMKLYPMLGIGGAGYGIQITKTKDVSLNDVLANSSREINIMRGGLVFDLSFNLNLIPVLRYDEGDQSYGGFMTGLKVGYVYSAPSSHWEYAGGNVKGGPRFGMNMAYVQLIIGGMGYKVK